jgi:hypothetical protein
MGKGGREGEDLKEKGTEFVFIYEEGSKSLKHQNLMPRL